MRKLTTSELNAAFWGKVNKNGPIHPILKTMCWLWTGSRARKGYGMFYAGQKDGKRLNMLAHRWAYEQTIEIIPNSMLLCHHCDVILCVNPQHMFIGSVQDNSDDMVTKGRSARGERQGSSVLTERDVREIHRRALLGEAHRQLGGEFGIAPAHVSLIMLGKCWRHLGLQKHVSDSRNKAKKLTREDVIQIRSSTLKGVEIARAFSISPGMVCNIRKGKAWNHIQATE